MGAVAGVEPEAAAGAVGAVPRSTAEADLDADQGICYSMDIRNSIEAFRLLRGCRVVEGFVHIVLMDNTSEEDFAKLSFPELREITRYLVVFRVAGLTSLGRLFPNLTVIRGGTLFVDYALVVFEVFSLRELGLRSLTLIERGGVRIEKNDHLCWVHTVDWNHIAPAGEAVVVANAHPATCAHEQRVCAAAGCRGGGCWGPGPDSDDPLAAPAACQQTSLLVPGCDPQCLGGCSGPGPTGCYACKGVLAPDGACVDKCPPDSFLYLRRRCVSAEECRRMQDDRHQRQVLEERQRRANASATASANANASAPSARARLNESPSAAPRPTPSPEGQGDAATDGLPQDLQVDDAPVFYWPFNGTCVQECPQGWEKRADVGCAPCEGRRCRRVCKGALVDSLAAAQNLRGCTTIEGSLEVHLPGSRPHAQRELRRSLRDIEEITEHLKVWRSFAILSLDILPRLHTIHGTKLDGGYALKVMENQNLRSLWEWDDGGANSSTSSTPSTAPLQQPRFRVLNGSLLFHDNPRLCPQYIDRLIRVAGLNSSLQVVESNGDLVACHTVQLKAWVATRMPRGAVIQWAPVKSLPAPATLLGYLIYYREAPAQNVSRSSGREVCGGEGWEVQDAERGMPQMMFAPGLETSMSAPLTQLKSFTQYAFYVTTYSRANRSLPPSVTPTGASSDIVYFTTLPSRPAMPLGLAATASDPPSPLESAAVSLRWQPPAQPNGIILHYVVWGRPLADTFLEEGRDFCRHPLPAADTETSAASGNVDTDAQTLPSTTTTSSTTPSPASSVRDGDNTATTDGNCPGKVGSISKGIITSDDFFSSCSISVSSDRAVDCTRFFQDSIMKLPVLPERNQSQIAHYQQDFSFPADEADVDDVDGVVPTDLPHLNNSFHYVVPANVTEYMVASLPFFTHYAISLSACREVDSSPDGSRDVEPRCSEDAVAVVRTRPSPVADAIDSGAPLRYSTKQITNSSSGAAVVFVRWSPPTSPNGPLLHYSLQWWRTDIKRPKPVTECITPEQHAAAAGGAMLLELLPGRYAVRVRAHTLAGPGPWTRALSVTLEAPSTGQPSSGLGAALIVLLVCFVLAVLAGGACWWFRWRSVHRRRRLFATVNPDYASASAGTYVEDEWEVARDRVRLIRELGRGSFGLVLEGRLLPAGSPCAVKMVNTGASARERYEFLNEASVMKAFSEGHHVVRLLGVVSRGEPPMVLMELMARGDLKSCLRAARGADQGGDATPDAPPMPAPDPVACAAEIADGMAYLESSKFVHRDLAARNCMVAADGTVKIGDFGMTRDIYETDYYRNGSKGLLPVRWMAPESLADGIFTAQSDVWSYGVVLWEVATLAEQPYQGLANEQVLQFVLGGGLLELPPNCHPLLSQFMDVCWRWRPGDRPTFLRILGLIEEELGTMGFSQRFRDRSFYHSPSGQDALAAMARQQQQQQLQGTGAPTYTAACPRVCFYHSDDCSHPALTATSPLFCQDRTGFSAHYVPHEPTDEEGMLLLMAEHRNRNDSTGDYVPPDHLPPR